MNRSFNAVWRPRLLALASLLAYGFAMTPVALAAETGKAVVAHAAEWRRDAAAAMVIGVSGSIKDGADALSVAKSLGVSSVRTDVPWKEVEVERGKFAMPDWVEQTVDKGLAIGLEPLLILDYGNPLYGVDKPKTKDSYAAFQRYALFVLDHFKGRVKRYELWNEWNGKAGGTQPGDAASYLAFAREVAPALKRAHPEITLLSAGVSGGGLRDGWLATFLKLKGYQYFDGVALHPYTFYAPTDRTPEGAMRLVDEMQEIARATNGGAPVDFYLTEIGWPVNRSEYGSSADQAGAYAARMLLMAACRPFIRGLWWYSLHDGAGDPANVGYGFGLYDPRSNAKPAAGALSKSVQMLTRSEVECTRDNGGGQNVRLERPDGSGGWLVRWNESMQGDADGDGAQREHKSLLSGAGASEVRGLPRIQSEPARQR